MIILLLSLIINVFGFKYIPIDLSHNYPLDINFINLSPNAEYVIESNFGGDVSLWQLSHNKQTRLIKHRNKTLGQYYIVTTFSPDSHYLVLDSALSSSTYKSHGRIELYNMKTLGLILSVNTHLFFTEWPNVYCFSNNSQYFAYADDSHHEIRIYNLYNYQLLKKIKEKRCITALAFSYDSTTLFYKRCATGNVTVYNLLNDTSFLLTTDWRAFDTEWTRVPTIIPDPQKKYLVTHSTAINQILIWNLQTGQLLSIVPWMNDDPIVISPDGNYLIYSIEGFGTSLYKLANFTLIKTIDDHTVGQIAFGLAEEFVIIPFNQHLCIFDLDDFSLLANYSLPTNEIIVNLRPIDFQSFYTVGERGTLLYWSL
jgi:WD40 repeat protein